MIRKLINDSETAIQKQVNDIVKFKKAKRSYPRQTGPIYSHLGDVLKRIKISGQAYHRHSFIGNQWIKYLKTKCTKEVGTVIKALPQSQP